MNLIGLINNPIEMLTSLLIALPGVLLALSVHEAAHGWVADRCGDPTARLMGRVTLNPLKHINPVGFLCMMLVGFGWATPVPVNPLNFRNYRRDDLKVSLAGITANLCMAIVGAAVLMGMFGVAVSKLPTYESEKKWMRDLYKEGKISLNGEIRGEACALVNDDEERLFCLMKDGQYLCITEKSLYQCASGIWVYSMNGESWGIEEMLIGDALGWAGSTAYRMVLSFLYLNLGLAVFNLIPLPPLDGYHVLNDLILKRELFADVRAQRMGTGLLFLLIMLGNVDSRLDIISMAIGFVRQHVLDGLTTLAYWISRLI